MNFMSDRTGFCSDTTGTTRGMSSPSSSSSSNRGLPLYTYHHHDSYGSGAAGPPEFSPTNNVGGGGGDEDSDDHMGVPSTAAEPVEKEHMFDKVVTPSDVGKLNRLVIPKQHAEKYFPLDSAANEKGLLLNFEDRNGKQWRFRYSYWNSSQSYVMTKGWSRFVKEKKLDAGDIVTFQRGAGDSGRDRLFIEWRRRPDAPELRPPPPIPTLSIPHHYLSFHRPPLFLQPPSRDHYSSNLIQYSNAINHQNHYYNHPQSNGSSYPVVDGNPCMPMYLRSGEVGRQREQMVYESVPVVQGKAAAKRLRLFGVNMDCPISSEDASDHTLLNHHSTIMPIHHNFLDFPPPHPPPQSSSSIRPNYDDKGKGSMSLDLDI